MSEFDKGLRESDVSFRITPSASSPRPDTDTAESLAAMAGNLMGGSVDEHLPLSGQMGSGQQDTKRDIRGSLIVLPGGLQDSAATETPKAT